MVRCKGQANDWTLAMWKAPRSSVCSPDSDSCGSCTGFRRRRSPNCRASPTSIIRPSKPGGSVSFACPPLNGWPLLTDWRFSSFSPPTFRHQSLRHGDAAGAGLPRRKRGLRTSPLHAPLRPSGAPMVRMHCRRVSTRPRGQQSNLSRSRRPHLTLCRTARRHCPPAFHPPANAIDARRPQCIHSVCSATYQTVNPSDLGRAISRRRRSPCRVAAAC
jgi:hypothetical protein